MRTSLPQLRYYWGLVLELISERTGYTKEDIHAFNKKNFGLRTTVTIDGEIIERCHGLRKGKKATAEFIEKVIHHWEERLGEHIPQPNELSEEELIKAYNQTAQ